MRLDDYPALKQLAWQLPGVERIWRAKGIEVVLHEHRGGFAFNVDSMHGIAGKARAEVVEIDASRASAGRPKHYPAHPW